MQTHSTAVSLLMDFTKKYKLCLHFQSIEELQKCFFKGRRRYKTLSKCGKRNNFYLSWSISLKARILSEAYIWDRPETPPIGTSYTSKGNTWKPSFPCLHKSFGIYFKWTSANLQLFGPECQTGEKADRSSKICVTASPCTLCLTNSEVWKGNIHT